ncbi:helix-turn-helix transcriptional regulator [Halosquirtibacter xylanolyticus]|uniref:helix-turn-helix transcriptional regulator n=1 Tax=Halosquirtibacter xylanolyticus TaxID=3374599 RepID=UPI003748B316
MVKRKHINRVKIVLAEKAKTNKWLAEQLGKSLTTVSRWCTNETQPSIETVVEIAEILDVDARELIVSTKQNKQ